jgi:hypothetical protein
MRGNKRVEITTKNRSSTPGLIDPIVLKIDGHPTGHVFAPIVRTIEKSKRVAHKV